MKSKLISKNTGKRRLGNGSRALGSAVGQPVAQKQHSNPPVRSKFISSTFTLLLSSAPIHSVHIPNLSANRTSLTVVFRLFTGRHATTSVPLSPARQILQGLQERISC